jgi:peptide/nickel transport system permease protein
MSAQEPMVAEEAMLEGIQKAARPTSARRERLAFLRTKQGAIGLGMLLFVLGVAVFGPLLAPYDLAAPIDLPGAPPDSGSLLGTDEIGRDVFSRVLHGGMPVISLSALSLLLVYAIGVPLGALAGLRQDTRSDSAIMRTVDLLITFPPLLLLLLLVAGAGTSFWTLLVGIVLVLFPGVVRIARSATQTIALSGYVESAQLRGERFLGLLRHEILPNIAPTLLADLGLRFSGAVVLAASVNFLGLGAQPPAANWGLMIAENRSIFATNIWALIVPAALLAMLTISVNLLGDAYVARLTRSEARP